MLNVVVYLAEFEDFIIKIERVNFFLRTPIAILYVWKFERICGNKGSVPRQYIFIYEGQTSLKSKFQYGLVIFLLISS